MCIISVIGVPGSALLDLVQPIGDEALGYSWPGVIIESEARIVGTVVDEMIEHLTTGAV